MSCKSEAGQPTGTNRAGLHSKNRTVKRLGRTTVGGSTTIYSRTIVRTFYQSGQWFVHLLTVDNVAK